MEGCIFFVDVFILTSDMSVDVVAFEIDIGVEINVDVAVEVDDASESDTVTKVDLVDDVDDNGVDGVIMWLCGDVVIDNNIDTSGSMVNVELYLGVASKTGEVADALFGAFVVIFENVLSVGG